MASFGRVCRGKARAVEEACSLLPSLQVPPALMVTLLDHLRMVL